MTDSFDEINEFSISRAETGFFTWGVRKFTVADSKGTNLFIAKRSTFNELLGVGIIFLLFLLLIMPRSIPFFAVLIFIALIYISAAFASTRKMKIAVSPNSFDSVLFNIIPDSTFLSLRNRYYVTDRNGMRIGRVVKISPFKMIWNLEDLSGKLLVRMRRKKFWNFDLIDMSEKNLIGKVDGSDIFDLLQAKGKFAFRLTEESTKGIDRRLVIGLALALADFSVRIRNRLSLS